MKIRIYPKSLLETMWQQDKLLFTPEAEQPPLCLRCGQPLDCRLVINALSRYADGTEKQRIYRRKEDMATELMAMFQEELRVYPPWSEDRRKRYEY